MDTILITGVAGFIGINLASKLLENENNKIIGIDNLSDSSLSSLYGLLKHPRFNFIQEDILSYNLPYADKIYHLANSRNFLKYNKNPFCFIKNKFDILEKILNHTSDYGAKTIIVSDLENNTNLKSYKNYIPLENSIIKDYIKTNNANIKVVKTSICYGQNFKNNDFNIISNIILKCMKNEEIKYDCNVKSHYTFIEDLTNGLILVMDKYIDTDIVDIYFEKSIFTFELANLIKELTNSNSVVSIDRTNYFDYTTTINSNYLKENFDFECSTSLKDGLIKTIEFAKIMYF